MTDLFRASGAGAVMASRAPIDPGELDYFPTPPWAARAGAELVRALDPAPGLKCWEPAAGGGHMALPLLDYFSEVSVSDIHDHGGPLSPLHHLGDFLDPDFGQAINADWIISNPPFRDGAAFVRSAWRRAGRGVAMLLRLQFLESAERYRLFREETPLRAVGVFSDRVPMVKGRWDPEASTATAYGWFIMLKPGVPGYGRPPEVLFIPPGTRERLWRDTDVRQFASVAAAPLLEGLE